MQNTIDVYHKEVNAMLRQVDTYKIVAMVEEYAKCESKEICHDWGHVNRVRNFAKYIARMEHADMFVVELAALLHDVNDSKLNGGDIEAGSVAVRTILGDISLPQDIIEHVANIVRFVSYATRFEEESRTSLELMVVQDADRLDALGAIGIARVFTFGGHIGHPIYDPGIPLTEMTWGKYHSNAGTTINHFHEKLLLLKDSMNTVTARMLAHKRHAFMLSYLEQFQKELDGEA